MIPAAESMNAKIDGYIYYNLRSTLLLKFENIRYSRRINFSLSFSKEQKPRKRNLAVDGFACPQMDSRK